MKNKTFFLLFALMLGFATVNAQSNEKYEYAFVEYFGKTVKISTTEGVFEERKVETPSIIEKNKKEFLNIIKEMNDKGWQVIGTDYANGHVVIYHLQKKRTN